MLPFNKKLRQLARNLRSNMTDAELLLWSKIRRKEIYSRQFYRQKNIANYIVDFCCPRENLILEIDGGQHYTDEGLRKDQARDQYLERLGFTVMHFSDVEVLKNIDGVVEQIYQHLIKSPWPPLTKGVKKDK
jgi:very-short-patch-repair endonuclease